MPGESSLGKKEKPVGLASLGILGRPGPVMGVSEIVSRRMDVPGSEDRDGHGRERITK